MRFTFVDRVLELEPGVRITTVKSLSLAEEYLADHFPRFPVMPGVLMLEAMTEASAWLIRATEDFAHSVVTLQEARNIRFADFVQPGHVLSVSAEIVSCAPNEVQLKTQGSVDGRTAVSGRLTMHRSNLSDKRPQKAALDAYLIRALRERFAVIYHPHDDVGESGGPTMLTPMGVAAAPMQGKV